MQDIKQALCSAMYRFVSARIKELRADTTWGFESLGDMMMSIQTDWQDAAWALSELCWFGFSKNYAKECFIVDYIKDEYETPVYCIIDDNCNKRYLSLIYANTFDNGMFETIVEYNRVTKMVEITDWEEVQNG